MILITLSGCILSTASKGNFCDTYTVEQFYIFEEQEIEYAIENGTRILTPQLKQKLENLAAHDTLGC